LILPGRTTAEMIEQTIETIRKTVAQKHVWTRDNREVRDKAEEDTKEKESTVLW